jgi:hypothetical protein
VRGLRSYERHKEGGNGLQVTPSQFGINFPFDQRDPNERDFQVGLADWVVHASHMSRFLVFSISAVAFNV